MWAEYFQRDRKASIHLRNESVESNCRVQSFGNYLIVLESHTAEEDGQKRKMPREAAFHAEGGRGLDADAKLGRLLVAGARVEVVGGAALELIARTKFATDVEADCGNGHTYGDPSNNLEGLGLLFVVEEGQIAGFCRHKLNWSPNKQ